MDSVTGIVGIGSVLLAVGVCLWLLIDGFRTGVVKGKRAVARAHEPTLYWVMMTLYGALPAWTFALIVWGGLRSH
jgi:hypothetical protein